MNESRFFIKLVDITDLIGLLHNVRLGLRLLKRGKIQLRTSKIENSSITEILEKIEKEEHQ